MNGNANLLHGMLTLLLLLTLEMADPLQSTMSSMVKVSPFKNFISVPQKVSQLKAVSMGWLRSLKVTWLPPGGDWERYSIVVLDHSTVLLNSTVQKDKREYIIKDIELVPGKEYEVAVIVESGGLQNTARCKGRTGKQPLIVVIGHLQKTMDVWGE